MPSNPWAAFIPRRARAGCRAPGVEKEIGGRSPICIWLYIYDGRGPWLRAGVIKPTVIVAALSIATAAPAYARTTTIATLTGHCTNIVGMGVTTDPSWCSDKLQNLDMANGRNGFTFVVNKPGEQPASLVISFFGWGPKQTHPDKDHVNQPIDRC